MLDAVCVVDKSGNFVYASAAFESMFGYAPEEVIGKPVIDFVCLEDNKRTLNAVGKLKSGVVYQSFENRWIHKSGNIVDVLWSARWSEKHQMRIAVAHDITGRKQMENKLVYLANHDSLTQLPNRLLLRESLNDAIACSQAKKSNFCLLFLDVNRFKQINDQYGHSLGDRVLAIVAKRLVNCVRHSDTVGRLGGDEFLIVLNSVAQHSDALLFSEKIKREIEKPIALDKVILNVSLSVGIARYPQDAGNIDDLLQYADKAMYTEKQRQVERLHR